MGFLRVSARERAFARRRPEMRRGEERSRVVVRRRFGAECGE